MMRLICVAFLWILLATASYLIYHFRSQDAVKDALEWVAQPGVATVYGFIFLVAVGLTSYFWKAELSAWVRRRRNKQTRDSISLLTDAPTQGIHLGLKVRDLADEAHKGSSLGRGWSIRVENPVKERAEGGVANLIDLGLEDANSPLSLDQWPKNRPLHWSNQRQDPFEIEGFQTAALNVVYYDYAKPGDDGRKFTIAYRGDDQFRADNYLPMYESRIIFIIRLTSRGAKPIYIGCRLDMKAASDLIYRGLGNITPFEILRHGADVIGLKDFQIHKNNY